MMAIKICGLTSEETIHAVNALGISYAGFVYYPRSPRHLPLIRAAALKSMLDRNIRSVSVLVNPDNALLVEVHSTLAPDYIQLHGNETPERIAEIKSIYPNSKIIKAISVRSAEDVAQAGKFTDVADMLLFDAKIPEPLMLSPPFTGGIAHPASGRGNMYLPGGTGLSFDWSLLKNREFSLPWFLAGGLNADNVAEAIRISGAKAVDVSSGVESSPGIKDVALIQSFVKAARHEI